jgi:SAM-dependent methyltransferase
MKIFKNRSALITGGTGSFGKNLLMRLLDFCYFLKYQPMTLKLGFISKKNYYFNDTSVISSPYEARHLKSKIIFNNFINKALKNKKKIEFLNAGAGDGLLRQIFMKSYFDTKPVSMLKFFEACNYYTNEAFEVKKEFKKINNTAEQFPKNFLKGKLNGNLADKNFLKKFPEKKNFFDFIVLYDVLEHVTNPFIVIENIVKMMKKKSKLIITVPFLQGYHEDPIDCFRYTHVGIKHLFINFLIENKILKKTRGGGGFKKSFKIIESFYDISQRRMKDRKDNFYFRDTPIIDSYGGYRETWHNFFYVQKLF